MSSPVKVQEQPSLRDEERMSELGTSPTIFSLLQGSSVPSSRAASFINASSVPSSRANGFSNARASVFNTAEDGVDIPEDDLLFSISLDQHDDGNYLADSTRDYLHL